MANKQYISPIRFFEHAGIDHTGELNITRIRKQVMAEFDLSASGFVELEGFSYNRNDLLEELEQPDLKERLAYHARIWQNKALLAVLEENKVDITQMGKDLDNFQNEPAFDAFFSPWFAGPFAYASRNFITNNKIDQLGDWLRFEGFLLPAEREEAFKPLRLFIEESLHVFRNISKENYYLMRPKMPGWLTWGWSTVMNNLPDEFYQVRNDIIVLLINITVKVQHSYREDCRNISYGLMSLKDVPQNLRDTIINNDRVYNNTGGSGSDSGSFSYGWIIWLIIIVIRLATCNHW